MNNDFGINFRYLIVNENDKKFGLTINRIGFQTIQIDSIYPLKEKSKVYYFPAEKDRNLVEYQFVYIIEGSGILHFNSENSTPISKGIVIIIPSGQLYSYYPIKDSVWKEYYIGFSGEIIDNLIENMFFDKTIKVLNVGINEELVSLYKRAIEIARTDKTATQQHLLGIVMHMIGLILSESQNSERVVVNSK